jgi:hypothetical protein
MAFPRRLQLFVGASAAIDARLDPGAATRLRHRINSRLVNSRFTGRTQTDEANRKTDLPFDVRAKSAVRRTSA